MTEVSAATAKAMKANKGYNTKPELAIRSLLHSIGLRYRVNYKIVLGKRSYKPDIVFTKDRLAVYIDGCFWHSCPSHGKIPKSNAVYWAAKFHRNRERDQRDNDLLTISGWEVLRIWEHVPAIEAADIIIKQITKIRKQSPSRNAVN